MTLTVTRAEADAGTQIEVLRQETEERWRASERATRILVREVTIMRLVMVAIFLIKVAETAKSAWSFPL